MLTCITTDTINDCYLETRIVVPPSDAAYIWITDDDPHSGLEINLTADQARDLAEALSIMAGHCAKYNQQRIFLNKINTKESQTPGTSAVASD